MGYAMSYKDSETIFNELASVTPSYAGISYDRIEHEGIHWPCPTPEHPGPHFARGPVHPGQGLFHAIDWIAPAEWPTMIIPCI
jgi:formate dehydrogenase major subunit